MSRRYLSHILVAVIVALIVLGIKSGPKLFQPWFHIAKTTDGASSGTDTPVIHVWFSPHGGCTEACVREIDSATNSILVQAYSFTSKPIAAALVHAHEKGVKVAIILDKSQLTEKYTEARTMVANGIPTYIDPVHAIAHNKVMIVDGHDIITGSFNFTTSAEERNAENMLIINSQALAIPYLENWNNHRAHSYPLK